MTCLALRVIRFIVLALLRVQTGGRRLRFPGRRGGDAGNNKGNLSAMTHVGQDTLGTAAR
jgi:hypothetical protein